MKTGICMDERFLLHNPGKGHPERPERLQYIYEKIGSAFAIGRHLHPILPEMADESAILAVHSPFYLDLVKQTAQYGMSALSADTFACRDSYSVSMLAAGSMLRAVVDVIEGYYDNAFVLSRPPGHHAEKNRGMGFCIFNNIAIAAEHSKRSHGLDRILIVDWDVHHGNGTQHIFEADPCVLYFSTHQSPHYPGTGYFTETGRGPGEGMTINVPLPRGYGDAEIVKIFQEILVPASLEFRPELVLVSAGFDPHVKDPLSGMLMTETGFAALTRLTMDIASAVGANGPIMILEGGYHLPALSDSVAAVLSELCQITRTETDKVAAVSDAKMVGYAIERAAQVHAAYWSCF